MVTGSFPNTQRVEISVNPVDDFQHAVPVDGEVRFEIVGGDASAELERLSPNAVDVVPGEGALGELLVEVSADADVGAGVELIQERVQIHFTHPKATHLGIGLAGKLRTAAPAPAATQPAPTPTDGEPPQS